MRNKNLFITMLFGIIVLSGASITAITDGQLNPDKPVSLPSANEPALIISTEEKPPLVDEDTLTHPTNSNALAPLADTNKLTLPININRPMPLASTNTLTRWDAAGYGTRSGIRIGGLYGLPASAIFSSSVTPQIMGRALFVALGTGSCMAVGGSLGATAGLLYANRKLRKANDRPLS